VFTEITEPKCADGAPACHHSFSGSGQIDLFHTLESPPGDPFGLAYLLYSTVEASLMRIVIVDERVAEAMINEENVLFGDLHTKLLNARIYPMFQIQPGTESDTIPLSPAVGEALANVQDEFNRYNKKTRVQNGKFGLKKGESDLSTGEGFHLGDDAPKSRAIRPFMKEQITSRTVLLSAIAPISYVDALVIHEGVADIISSKLGDDWDSSDILAVFSETPGIIRTSGRGSQTRHLDSSLPFVEFTVVGATTYQNLNKVGLSRSLLGVRKGEHDQ